MRLNHDEWLDALTNPPNYDVQDFSVARIQPIASRDDDVERTINAFRVEAIHNGSGIHVVMTLRFPDHLIPFVAQSFMACAQHLEHERE